MKLYYFETPNARKPCAVAKYLGSPVAFVRTDLSKGETMTPEFLAINPNHKIPVLSDGDTNVFESYAIMAYLSHKAGADLWPSDPAAQIDAIKWMAWDNCHFTRHAATMTFENYFKPAFGMGEPDAAKVEEASGFVKRFAAVLDGHLKGRRYVVGDQLSIVDFGIASFLPTATEAKLPLDGCDEIKRWHDSLMEIDAWRNPWPQA